MHVLERVACVSLAVAALAPQIVRAAAPSHEGLLRLTGQRQASKARPTLLTWSKVPVCLDATAPARSANQPADALDWKSSSHSLRTGAGTVALRRHDDEAVLFVNEQATAIGADEQGRAILLGDRSVSVRGFPDCDAPDYLFIAPSGGDQTVSRRWFLDGRRAPGAGESAAIEFPGRYDSDTVVSLRGGMLTVSSGAADGDETTFQYHDGAIHAFVHAGTAPKYMNAIGKANDEFYRSAATDAVLRAAGQETFDLLRVRTSAGKTRLFRGRYLIVEGAAAGDFQRHGVVVVDTTKDTAFYALCDDSVIESGAIVAASHAQASQLERGGEDVLSAFRFAGLTLTFDDSTNLVCDGECHDER